MYAEYENEMDGTDFFYERAERTSDIQLPPAITGLLLAVWLVICLIGFGVMVLGKNPVAGAIIIAVPTFIGMVIKPTFALCIMMLVIPTGAGFGYRQVFSLDHGVGIALAVSFFLNILITRPRLRIDNKALWVLAMYTIWVFVTLLTAAYLATEFRNALTVLQLLALVLIVYWILETNSEGTFRWALRAYIIGTLGTIAIAFTSGAAVRVVEETAEGRYEATAGEAIGANMLASLTVMAFLAAIYLLWRDKSLFWRVLYLVTILLLPIMLLKIGSRGAMIALAFTLLSPLIFVRQVLRRPGLAMLVLMTILLASVAAGLMARTGELEAGVARRLTDVGRAKEAISYRMVPIRRAVEIGTTRVTGTGYYGWFKRSGVLIIPHNDFFAALGFYGIPGAALFTLFVIMMILTVRRIPLGPEKLYARAVLTFFLVMGLNISQLNSKHFWLFLAFVMATERTAKFFTTATSDLVPYEQYEADLLPQHQLT